MLLTTLFLRKEDGMEDSTDESKRLDKCLEKEKEHVLFPSWEVNLLN